MRFRRRAADCRALAKVVPDERDRQLLTDFAKELDEEADRIERRNEGYGEA